MTFEALKQILHGGVGIACESPEERNAVIQLMLEMGYEHGDSEVSTECLQGAYDDDWFAPFISGGYEIEFYPIGREDDIPFDEIAHLVKGVAIPARVDDLI